MVEFVRFILLNLVENPDEVDIKQIDGDTTTILEISVAKSDMGHVIGKGGKVINAVRELVRSTCREKGKKIRIEVI